MLFLWILVALAVVGGAVALLSMRRSHEDEHSVEGYHRQLNTLSHIKAHAGSEGDGVATPPDSALRVSGMRSVRVTDGPPAPVPPPVVPEGAPIKFDDAGPPIVPSGLDSFKRRDKAMNAMNKRPARLGAPVLAVVSVLVLIVVLLIIGSHQVPPAHHGGGTSANSATSSQRTVTHHHAKKHRHSTTTTTQPPLVSFPHSISHNAATYVVQPTSYTLVVSASNESCWVDVTSGSTDVPLFEGVLSAGQHHTLSVDGPLSIEVGAPSAFAATVNGSAVALPFGFQTPFTMLLESAAAYSSGSGSGSTTTASSSSTSPAN